MIKKMGVVADFDRGISPYIKKNKKAYDLIKCQNSLGNEFLFVTEIHPAIAEEILGENQKNIIIKILK